MPSILALVGLALLLAFLRYPYRLARNYYYAKRTGLACVVLPFDQDAFLWMLASIPLRPVLQPLLPKWIWDRLAITVWGWEYHVRREPWEKFASGSADPKTLAWVTAGNFEINTWDPEFAQEILKRPKDFNQPGFNALFIGRFGENVLTTDGDKWARQRKVIAQVINERLSRSIFDETTKQAQGLLDEVTDEGARETADTLGLFDMMKKITIHVLSGAGMGQPVEWDNTSEKPEDGHQMTYMTSAKSLMEAVEGPIILPNWFLLNYPSWMPGHAWLKQVAIAIAEYPMHTKQMLHEEAERLSSGHAEVKTNILSQLLEATNSDKTGVSLTETELISNLFVFTAAGFDTTANTLSFALACLSRQPKWQQWMFEEIDALLDGTPEKIDYTAIFPRALRIMAVMLETLRIFPPLVHIAKQSTLDKEQIIKTSKGTYRIPPGTQTYVSSVCLHIEPSVWRGINMTKEDELSATSIDDELVFRPTRWIVRGDTPSLFRPPPFTYLPWSAGPRNCPGTKMAQVEFVATFLTLFRNHKISAAALQVPGKDGELREETLAEVELRMDARIKASNPRLTLQMDNIYDMSTAKDSSQGLKIRISKRK